MKKNIDFQDWLNELLNKYNVDLEKPFNEQKIPDKPIDIDLREFESISFFNLLNLFLVIDYFQDYTKHYVNVFIRGLCPEDEFNRKEYYEVLNNPEKEINEFQEYNKVYTFLFST